MSKTPTRSHQLELLPLEDARQSPSSKRKSSAPGWYGLGLAKLEIDWQLAAKLAPDGEAVKVTVAPRSPARRAGIRTGDYVTSVSPRQHAGMSLLEFDAGKHPAGTVAFVKYYRPTWRDPRHIELALVTLSAPPGPPKQKWWERLPRCDPGEEVQRDQRKNFLGQMAAHRHITKLGVRLLTRMLHHYQGRLGICPSYRSLMQDMGTRRRATVIEHMHALEWVGVVEVETGAGVPTRDGRTNAYRITWPAGWNVLSFASQEGSEAARGELPFAAKQR
jgi:hypothetical protein